MDALKELQASVQQEAETRERIAEYTRQLETEFRVVAVSLNRIHTATTDAARDYITKLSALIPPAKFYRYNSIWSRVVQQGVFAAALITYLNSKTLLQPDQVQEFMGAPVHMSNAPVQEFHITVEEYLHGIFSLPAELARLAVNSVTRQTYQRPLEISTFVTELFASFQLLNLKNDSLRKHFDGIKYEVKKIEEIVYNISVRGLTQS
ncbi:Translin-1 [Dimargaris verticillata]|uniref:Translin-1 n=1 Tax=Dimargaris verticillata TaxID=2761393 RepID=A0A9W8B485_9FUNG|nr:Translin-1 [Dimargaris verticillata]